MTGPVPVLEVLAAGGGGSLQDGGRPGWRAFGVPLGGAMDDPSRILANRLLGNPDWLAALELAGGGQRFRALAPVSVALAGAVTEGSHPAFRSFTLAAGEELSVGRVTRGVWSYLAVAGGYGAEPWLGSVSALPRAGLGLLLRSGVVLHGEVPRVLPADRSVARAARWDLSPTPPLRVWPGPQAAWFTPEDRARFFDQPWTVSTQCDRVGYRLEGEPLQAPAREMISEPQPLGSIQIARDGRPIVLMRDGPAVGGYPRLGILHADDLPRLAQGAPGQPARFQWLG